VENNQLYRPTTSQPAPPWLPELIKLPGFSGQSCDRGDGVIADPATKLDPRAKAGPIITPNPGPRVIEARHLDANDLFEITNLSRDEIDAFRERLQLVFEPFFRGTTADQVMFEAHNPLIK
jgi:hypothetical protein